MKLNYGLDVLGHKLKIIFKLWVNYYCYFFELACSFPQIWGVWWATICFLMLRWSVT